MLVVAYTRIARGTKTRPGLVIVTATAECADCHRTVICDRWTGEYKTSNPASDSEIFTNKNI